MTDNWNPAGPIVVWENMGCEGWHPRSYPTLANALATAGITKSHVVTRLLDVERMISAAMEHPNSVDNSPGGRAESESPGRVPTGCGTVPAAANRANTDNCSTEGE